MTPPAQQGGGPRGQARGQALAEFAIVIPLFLLILFVLVDFGRVIYAQQTITQDAREGTRRGTVSAAYDTTIYQEIRSAALVGSPAVPMTAASIVGEAGACSAVPGGVDDPTSTTTCFYPDGVDPGDRVVVNITVTVPLITPIISQIVGGSFTISAQSIGFVQ